MRYFLGVDIGGTKSHALVADEEGQAIGFGEGGPGNWEVVGWDGLAATLRAITEQALAAAGIGKEQVTAVGFGIAGYDWPSEWEPTRQAIEAIGLAGPCAFVNDTVIGLLAGASEGWGVAVVAGTSNNCRGRDQQGREGRVTGCGTWFGEGGGAAEMVARAVQMAAMDWTRRGPPTRLSQAFVEAVGAVDLADLLEGLYMGRYELSASAAPLIFQAAAGGDQVAQELIRWAGTELGSLAVGVIRQLGFESVDPEVVLVGSLYDGSPALIEAMRATIHAVAPGARLVRLTAPPVVGGVLLAMEQVGLATSAVRERLIATTRQMRK
ncbi:MAG: ATPase [Anaerolineae bacterium]|nr:ATPase [Anaerolineae bacterium]